MAFIFIDYHGIDVGLDIGKVEADALLILPDEDLSFYLLHVYKDILLSRGVTLEVGIIHASLDLLFDELLIHVSLIFNRDHLSDENFEIL